MDPTSTQLSVTRLIVASETDPWSVLRAAFTLGDHPATLTDRMGCGSRFCELLVDLAAVDPQAADRMLKLGAVTFGRSVGGMRELLREAIHNRVRSR